jgi:hypothetical protein
MIYDSMNGEIYQGFPHAVYLEDGVAHFPTQASGGTNGSFIRFDSNITGSYQILTLELWIQISELSNPSNMSTLFYLRQRLSTSFRCSHNQSHIICFACLSSPQCSTVTLVASNFPSGFPLHLVVTFDLLNERMSLVANSTNVAITALSHPPVTIIQNASVSR